MLEAMQETREFYHNKRIDVLQLDCTLSYLENNCLQKSTSNNFYSVVEQTKVYMIKYPRIRPVVPLFSSLETRLWIKYLFDTQKTFANQLWVYTPAQLPLFNVSRNANGA